MPASINLNEAFLSRVHGDLTTIYTWVNDERAIVIVPYLRKGAPWFVVCESALPNYNNERMACEKGILACNVLGIEPSIQNAMRIIRLVVDGTSDLIRMPGAPPPKLSKATFGEIKAKLNGKELASEAIRLPDLGATYA